ncbi:hypothetical protein [Amycolatopsis sp. YIM 10]|uniref:hypothetical protein n=1 Tax=Amycolatopsis sp. YIM 10 TaxID=2653857 RepID=UPI001290178B|nr:hypothetical protein [Amycolatopsis sp. YIM 10]QFU87847.1 hypothetical protein YIM_13305 [Amycolatopsis sp. YIM 10]QFU94840.1 hypothetical protein YIM_48575 [Amycolatopsis sp. YIM 10]
MPRRAHPTHACPCGCGARIAFTRYCCAAGWRRLPVPLRAAITSSYRRDDAAHAEAMLEAKAWFDAQRPAPRVFAPDGPEPEPSVTALHAPTRTGDGYLKRCDGGGWYWAGTVEDVVPRIGNSWPPTPLCVDGPLTEMRAR